MSNTEQVQIYAPDDLAKESAGLALEVTEEFGAEIGQPTAFVSNVNKKHLITVVGTPDEIYWVRESIKSTQEDNIPLSPVIIYPN